MFKFKSYPIIVCLYDERIYEVYLRNSFGFLKFKLIMQNSTSSSREKRKLGLFFQIKEIRKTNNY